MDKMLHLVELWQEIFSHLDHRGLFSTLLVNRDFCNMVIPVLWKDTWSGSLFKIVKLIRTYFSNLDKDSRTLLTQHGIDLSSSPSGTTFDYASLLRSLDIQLLIIGINFYLNNLNNRDFNDRKNVIFKELLKLFLTHSNISSLNFTFSSSRNSLLEVLISCRNSSQKIQSLNGLKFLIAHNLSSDTDSNQLINEITKNSVNIFRINMKLITLNDGRSLANLVRSQNNLEELMIVDSNNFYAPVLTAISTQSHSLVKLKLTGINFRYANNKALESLISCNNLKTFELEYCLNLKNVDSLATAFSQLEDLRIFHNLNDSIAENVILGFIRTANKNLKKIILSPYTNDIINSIAETCTNLQYLRIRNLDEPEFVINSISSLELFIHDRMLI